MRRYFGGLPALDQLMEDSLARAARCRRGAGGPGRHRDGAEARRTGVRGAPATSSRTASTATSPVAAATTKYRTLAELIEFNTANAAKEMPWFGQETFELAEKKGPLSEPAYRRALADCRRLARAEGMDATLRRHRLDAIVCPTGGPAWVTDLVNGDHWNPAGDSSTPAAVAGYPHITVPAGFVDGIAGGIVLHGAGLERGPPAALRVRLRARHRLRAARIPASSRRSPDRTGVSPGPARALPRRSSAPPGTPARHSPRLHAAPTSRTDTPRACPSPRPRCRPPPGRR